MTKTELRILAAARLVYILALLILEPWLAPVRPPWTTVATAYQEAAGELLRLVAVVRPLSDTTGSALAEAVTVRRSVRRFNRRTLAVHSTLSREEWQAAAAYWHARNMTHEQARRAEAFARDVAHRYPQNAGPDPAAGEPGHVLCRGGDAAG